MARIRSVHPSLFTDEAWVSCSPLARLLYIGLWTDADDQGLFEWKPLQIKMRLLPGDVADVPALLAELAGVGLLGTFDHGGKRFGAIKQFRRYQRPKKPNAIHFMPPEWREFVALDSVGSEPDGDEPAPVPNQFPTSGEKSPQMEDGGGREGEGKEGSEAIASSVAESDDEDDFEKLWSAYPHVKGRSSKPKSRTVHETIGADIRRALPSAAARFADGGTIPDSGAPALEKWLADERYIDWLEADRVIVPTTWSGPADFREAVAGKLGEDWTRSWLDWTGWQDVPERAIVCRLGITAKRLSSDLRKLLAEHGITVRTEQAA